ncbi:MAG TPA: PIG-L family deacetylase [Longimicrobiaceae bacterium]
MNRFRFLRIGVAAAALASGWTHPAPVRAQQAGASEYQGAAALGLSLRRLGTTKRVLMVGAHPDDEDTQLLSALALEQGADVAYLSLTRGEGGQNGIGTELGEALGILRTEELLAARRVDGAGQFFTRAYDFGFSKSAEETFRHWPRDSVLADVVGVIRRFRPDVLVTVFSGTPRDGHGQHQVSAMLAHEAFEAAGDPARFPEQLRAGLRPHRPRKLYQSLRGRQEGSTLRLAIGDLDPLLGRSPFQLAMASRSRHRSQDMGAPEPAGPRWGYLRRIAPAAGGPAGAEGGGATAEPSLFAGVDSTLSASGVADAGRRARLEALFAEYAALAGRLRREANPLAPGGLVPELARALGLLERAEAQLAGDAGAAELRFRIAAEREDARTSLARAAGLVFDAAADDARVVPGQTVGVTVSLWNGGERPVRVAALEPDLPAGWTAEPVDSLPSSVAPGALAARRFRVRVPANAEPGEAPFLVRPRAGDTYRWTGDWSVDGNPFAPAAVRARARVAVEGAEIPLAAEAAFREVDPRQGELRRPVLVVPAVSVLLEPRASVLPVPLVTSSASPAPVRLRVRLAAEAPGGVAGTARLTAPAGWMVEPREVPVRFAGPGEQREVDFAVRAPVGVRPGDFPVSAVFEAEDGRRFERGVQAVDYPHVRARLLAHPAAATVRAFDVRVPAGLKVAYVTGAGEEGPGVLAQLGIVPDLLDAEALAARDLSGYDVIVAGSRAYEVRPDLAASNARLLEYVRRGGTLIVQYNKYELVEGGFTPYPITMGRPHDRVTDEAAPVRVLEPAHPVLTTPNRITAADWEGWVQERGLYFARTWDPKYTPLLETGDPGEAPLRGGLLVAPLGQGTYVYTGLAFFRQLPEGVPGAWRLFANLLSLGAKR